MWKKGIEIPQIYARKIFKKRKEKKGSKYSEVLDRCYSKLKQLNNGRTYI